MNMSAQEIEYLRVDVVTRRLETVAEPRTYSRRDEAAGDHPVWHKSETDVFPGQHRDKEASS